jgi:hypothetical protein
VPVVVPPPVTVPVVPERRPLETRFPLGLYVEL